MPATEPGRARPDAAEAVALAPVWQVSRDLVRAALDGVGDGELVAVLGTALAAIGVEICIIEVVCDVVGPDGVDRCIRWRRGRAGTDNAVLATDVFHGMLDGDVTERRLPAGDAELARFAPDGATDGLAIAGHLAPDVTLGFFDDVMVLFVTDRPGGFAETVIEVLRRVMPVFALAIGARLNAAAARTLLQTYLGQKAATALLDGRVGLGDVATLRVVVLYCDLVGFTAMTEHLDPGHLVGRLNLFFETVTRPVAQAGGQVAGHVGDAVVMFFPVAEEDRTRPACAAALEAALAGARALNLVNAGCEPHPLRARFGIDMGDVVHGNIGSPGRFSFTIIGTPVNRAARLQVLAKDLGTVVLTTAAVATAAGVTGRRFGSHVVRGLGDPVEIVGLDLATAQDGQAMDS